MYFPSFCISLALAFRPACCPIRADTASTDFLVLRPLPTQLVFTAYLQVKEALVAADSNQAHRCAKGLLQALDQLPPYPAGSLQAQVAAVDKYAFSICKSGSLAGQRRFFAGLSRSMLAVVKATKPTTVYVQQCASTGDYWLSANPEIVSPYTGRSHSLCGHIIAVVGRQLAVPKIRR